jgi:hypothetical protein
MSRARAAPPKGGQFRAPSGPLIAAADLKSGLYERRLILHLVGRWHGAVQLGRLYAVQEVGGFILQDLRFAPSNPLAPIRASKGTGPSGGFLRSRYSRTPKAGIRQLVNPAGLDYACFREWLGPGGLPGLQNLWRVALRAAVGSTPIHSRRLWIHMAKRGPAPPGIPQAGRLRFNMWSRHQ